MKNTKKETIASPAASRKEEGMLIFHRDNYILIIGGLVLIMLGFLLMLGGGSDDPNVFNPDEIYSTRRVIIAPLVCLAGFGLEIYAIMKKPSA